MNLIIRLIPSLMLVATLLVLFAASESSVPSAGSNTQPTPSWSGRPGI